ncbi:uncharacterized protein CLUP02_04907 [Colletotrichum lupini]|uniref:Uncharacterized protein n=1 Tax=Colletotrichum lupini TaxID=145971 RepID=A0A9Q8SMZ2_9PEZI|nr:uncharacterized protein CLUP02_04907 [Colletotrichum lupini]UQC79427.1 hypothetical protein CLUP02_04907 [Colletotrichum lupini]
MVINRRIMIVRRNDKLLFSAIAPVVYQNIQPAAATRTKEPRKRSTDPLLGVAVGVLTPALSVGAITGVDAIVVTTRTDELPDADGTED